MQATPQRRAAASEQMDAGLWRGERDQADKDASKKDDAKKGAAAKKEPAKDKPVTVPVMPDAESGPLMKALSVASLELRAGVLVAQASWTKAKSSSHQLKRQRRSSATTSLRSTFAPSAKTKPPPAARQRLRRRQGSL